MSSFWDKILNPGGVHDSMWGEKKTSTSKQESWLELGKAGKYEQNAARTQEGAFNELAALLKSGPGAGDVAAGQDAERNFISMLDRYQQGGFLPSEKDFATSRGFVEKMFAPQQEALRQSFEQEQRQANRMAALTGRGPNDPVFMNQLAQSRTNQMGMLQSQMGAATADMASQLPMQQLQFAEAAKNARLGLAQQAIQNRSLLMQMGNTLREQERNFRLQTAKRVGTGTSTQVDSPSIGNTLMSIGSSVMTMGAGGGMGGMGGGGGGASPKTAMAPAPMVLPGTPVGTSAPMMAAPQASMPMQAPAVNLRDMLAPQQTQSGRFSWIGNYSTPQSSYGGAPASSLNTNQTFIQRMLQANSQFNNGRY